MSFDELIKNIITIYNVLITEDTILDSKKSNYIIESLNFLHNFQKTRDFLEGKVSNQNVYHFLKLLLDMAGLVSATEGSFKPAMLGDTKLIGRIKDLKGVYKGKDSKIDENMCATLFKGWIQNKDLDISISKDLRNVVPKKSHACDFLVESKVSQSLVECKRLHFTVDFNSFNDLIAHMAKKMFSYIDKAVLQFEETEDFLKLENCSRHLILDFSAYGKDCLNSFQDYEIVGLLQTKGIKNMVEALSRNTIDGIDEITLCWSEMTLFDSKPRAFTYRTVPVQINNLIPSLFSYDGWTIEFYPSGIKKYDYRELRISSTARSHAWIKASWYSSTDNLLTYGPVVKL